MGPRTPLKHLRKGAIVMTVRSVALLQVLACGCGRVNFEPLPGDGVASGADASVALRLLGAGTNYTCAVVGGEIRCWGVNGSGQLGDGTTDYHGLPTPTNGPGNAVAVVTSKNGGDNGGS